MRPTPYSCRPGRADDARSSGKLRLNLIVGDDDEATINIFSRKEPYGRPSNERETIQRIQFGCKPSSPEDVKAAGRDYHPPALTLFDGEGKDRAMLQLYPSGDGTLCYRDADGGDAIALQETGLLV